MRGDGGELGLQRPGGLHPQRLDRRAVEAVDRGDAPGGGQAQVGQRGTGCSAEGHAPAVRRLAGEADAEVAVHALGRRARDPDRAYRRAGRFVAAVQALAEHRGAERAARAEARVLDADTPADRERADERRLQERGGLVADRVLERERLLELADADRVALGRRELEHGIGGRVVDEVVLVGDLPPAGVALQPESEPCAAEVAIVPEPARVAVDMRPVVLQVRRGREVGGQGGARRHRQRQGDREAQRLPARAWCGDDEVHGVR